LNFKFLILNFLLIVLVLPITVMAKASHVNSEPLEAITPIMADDEQDPSLPIVSPTPSFTVTATPSPYATPLRPKGSEGQAASGDKPATPSVMATKTATPSVKTTATPLPALKLREAGNKPTPSATKKVDLKLPRITVIPNPARGTKVTFRVMTPDPVKVRLKVYNRFYDSVAELEGEGDHLFDILWSLKGVPEGPYSFAAQVIDQTTGQFTTLPLQKFTVEKDETPPDTQ